MRFLIVSTPRTASTLLAASLGSYCNGEIWLRPRIASYGWSFERAHKYPLEYFKMASKCGAKAMVNHLAIMSGVDTLFAALDNAIFLRRRNITEQAISLVMAQKFGFHSLEKREKPIMIDTRILEWEAEKWVSLYRKWWNLASSRCKVTSFWYEDIDTNPPKAFSEARSFLGLPPAPNIKPGLRKLRSIDRYKRVIVNYDEIIQKMGTVYGVPFGQPGNRWDDPGERWDGIVARSEWLEKNGVKNV